MKDNQVKLEKFEIVKCGPYRFIGKAVYVRNDWKNPHSATGEIVQSVWKAKDWSYRIFHCLYLKRSITITVTILSPEVIRDKHKQIIIRMKKYF